MFRRLLLLILAVIFLLTLSFTSAFEKPPARTPTLPQPKFITLQSDKLTLNQVLTKVASQTGIRVETLGNLSDKPLPLDLKRVTFWQGLDAIAAASDARVALYSTSGRIVLAKRGNNYRLPPISYDGRFRLSVKKMTAVRDLELRDKDPSHATYSAGIEVAWDPELQPLFLETRPRAVRLVDDKNNVLTIPDEGGSLAPVDGRIALDIDLRLPALPRSVAQISKLEGELSMIGPSKMLTFAFETLDKLTQRRLTREGVTCHIRKVIFDGQRCTIQVALDYPPGMKELDSNQSWVVNNEMTLESLDGKKRLTSSAYVLETATPRRAILSYHFLNKGDKDGLKRGNAGNWRLRYRAPANLIEAPIKFAFKDIPLP